jgi:hypothetical protein
MLFTEMQNDFVAQVKEASENTKASENAKGAGEGDGGAPRIVINYMDILWLRTSHKKSIKKLMELLVSIIKRYEKFPAQDNISFPNI